MKRQHGSLTEIYITEAMTPQRYCIFDRHDNIGIKILQELTNIILVYIAIVVGVKQNHM